MEIFTLGYARLKIEEFVDVLRKYRVRVAVDVRAFPTSKREEFKKENLQRYLKAHGIEYVHLPALGGYRKGGYAQHMKTPEFRAGIEEILKLASRGRVAIFCLEDDPRHCHRRYIAGYLITLGARVYHIRGGKAWEVLQ